MGFDRNSPCAFRLFTLDPDPHTIIQPDVSEIFVNVSVDVSCKKQANDTDYVHVFNLVSVSTIELDIHTIEQTRIVIDIHNITINIDKYYNSSIGAISTDVINAAMGALTEGILEIINTLFENGIDINDIIKGLLGSDFIQFTQFELTNLNHVLRVKMSPEFNVTEENFQLHFLSDESVNKRALKA